MQKKAIITGATSGIGKATAEYLAGKGFSLVLLARREERLKDLSKNLQTILNDRGFDHAQVNTFVLDISDALSVASWAKQNHALISEVEILVNNAGLALGVDRVFEAKVSDVDQMFDTNVKGLLNLTREVVPSMIARGRGHIVNIGSVAGRWVYPGGGVYCATKFAVRALSEGLRMDLLGTPIRVTNIEPGMVETEFSEVRLQDKQKAKLVYENLTPLSAQDIAETIGWVIERPSHVNIQELVIFPTDQAAVGMVHRHK